MGIGGESVQTKARAAQAPGALPQETQNRTSKRTGGKAKAEQIRPYELAACLLGLLAAFVLCICVGSINLPLAETLHVLTGGLLGQQASETTRTVILQVRLPRVLCVSMVGASLSLAGAAMQGLLRNPLADGTTLGVSPGASLGAVVALAFGITFPGLPFAGTTIMAILFAFLSLMAILTLSHKIDYSLSTNTIILIGVIFSMFANSLTSFVTLFSGEKVKSITFWLMGSLAGSSYINVLTLAIGLVICGTLIITHAVELNAFAIGEDNARNVGVNVRRVKYVIMISVSVLLGVSVSVGGTIGFVGLVTPHMTRMIVGPNHKRLLPASVFSGAVFLLFADLVSRTIMKPLELPVGVVTSFIGSIVFVYIFYTHRKGR